MIRQRVEGCNTCVIPELREGISFIYVITEMKPSTKQVSFKKISKWIGLIAWLRDGKALKRNP